MKKNKKSNIKKNKKKKTVIIISIITVIILLLAGITICIFVSGNDFSTSVNNIKQGIQNNSDSKNESNNINKDTDNENNNNNNNEDNNSEKLDNNSNTGMDSGKGADEVKDFKLSYDTRGIRNITMGGASFVCNQDNPEITGINKEAAKNIEDYIKKHYDEVWKDINEQTKDDYIKEILTQINEMSNNNPDYVVEDIGFHQSCEVLYINNKIVTIELIFVGGLGGVNWNSTTGVSFDLNTGNAIKMKDIVTSKKEYISACKKYAFEQLRKDSRYDEVIESHKNDYEKIINTAIEKMEGYFVKEGIVCAEIPKYEIASGAAGEFKFTVSYKYIKDYIDKKYSADMDIKSTSSNQQSKDITTQNKYSTTQLEKMALDYYEAKTGYRPSGVASQVNNDNTISIQLYDNMGDHNSTADWYTIDVNTATGKDIMENSIDLKVKPAREY